MLHNTGTLDTVAEELLNEQSLLLLNLLQEEQIKVRRRAEQLEEQREALHALMEDGCLNSRSRLETNEAQMHATRHALIALDEAVSSSQQVASETETALSENNLQQPKQMTKAAVFSCILRHAQRLRLHAASLKGQLLQVRNWFTYILDHIESNRTCEV